MERFYLHQIDSQSINGLPEESGVLLFYCKDTLLHVDASVNLRKKFAKLFSSKEDDFTVGELFSRADSLELIITKTPLEALGTVKSILSKQKPEFNQSIHDWKNYVYLAINPAEFPYVKITEYTEEEWFYLGPFRNRFFLVEMMELMQKLLKLPHCETKQGPCEKLEDGLCRGWCMTIESEVSREPNEESELPNLQKLDALLKEAYIHPDNGLLEMVQNQKTKYENDLQFIKADLLTDNIELLQRYKRWLIFLYKVKNLSYDKEGVSIRNGQLSKYKTDGIEYNFPIIAIKYRPNEILSINKNLLDEGWMAYLGETV